MKTLYYCLIPCFVLVCMVASVNAVGEFAVGPGDGPQTLADVDGSVVVWQEYLAAGHSDIFGIDLDSELGVFHIIDWENDQRRPAISGGWVVWQDDYYGDGSDYDIYVSDISNPSAILRYPVSTIEDVSETNPAIGGNLVAWQQEYIDSETAAVDWDVYAADVIEPNDVRVYPVVLWTEDQAAPAVYRSDVVFADYFTPDIGVAGWDITVADMWLENTPTYQYPAFEEKYETAPAIDRDYIVWQFDYAGDGTDYDIVAVDRSDPRVFVSIPISQLSSSECSPDISGHIVVWQDDRNGNWDIYGYNLITKQEFRITDDSTDQTNPAISGNLVVWEDMRTGTSEIYAVYLDAVDVADCPIPLGGDTDGDCRVTLVDFMKLAEGWLGCNLEPAAACNY